MQVWLSKVCILSHFHSTLTVPFSCVGVLLPVPTPNGDRLSGVGIDVTKSLAFAKQRPRNPREEF